MKLKHLIVYQIVIALILLVLTLLIQKCRSCEMVCTLRTDFLPDALWETNDIVDIFENGTYYGKPCLEHNYIVKIPDLSVAEAKAKYLKPRLDTNGKMVANRQYKIDTTKITIDKGIATTNKATLDTQVIKKSVAVAIEP